MSDYVTATYLWTAVASVGLFAPMIALAAKEATNVLAHRLSL